MLRCHGSRLNNVAIDHGRQHMGQMGSADPLEKLMKNQKAKTCKKNSFLNGE